MRVLIFSDNHPRLTSFIYQDLLAVSKSVEVLYVHSQPSSFTDANVVCIPFDLHSLRARISWKSEQFQLFVNHQDSHFKDGLNKLVNRFKPDVIHCQFAYEGIKIWDCIEKRSDHKFLFSFRGYDSTYKLRNSAYRRKISSMLSSPNVHAHFVCHYLRENLNRSDVETPRSNVIYTGIDIDHYSLDSFRNESKQKKVILQVGSFNEKKGQEITIDAFKKFLERTKRSDVSLRFVGEGKNLKRCMEQTKRLEIDQHVVFLGKKGKEDIREELFQADLFVHHSVTGLNGDQEGIPNALAEAMAMNLPVIGTQHAGIPELVLPEADGILVTERDVPAYAEAMEKMIDRPKSVVNRELIMKNFTLKKHVTGFLELYKRIAEGN